MRKRRALAGMLAGVAATMALAPSAIAATIPHYTNDRQDVPAEYRTFVLDTTDTPFNKVAFDEGEWKSEIKDVSSWDGKFTQKASFAIGLGTTVITQDAVFSGPVTDGCVRIRIRCADGTVQADSATRSAVKRDLPNHTATDLSSVFYFYGTTPECGSVSFSKI